MQTLQIVQPSKEIIIAAIVNLPQLNNDACTDIQFARFVFCISASTDVASATLQLGAQFLLRNTLFDAQLPQIVAQISVAPDFLFHCSTSKIDQYWLQLQI